MDIGKTKEGEITHRIYYGLKSRIYQITNPEIDNDLWDKIDDSTEETIWELLGKFV